MQLSAARDIMAEPAVVWAAILDPAVLMLCVPGCESMTGSVEAGFEAVVVQKIGPVSARFTGVVTISDMVPGQSLQINGEGKGGAAGFAKGGAKVTFTKTDGGTRLDYEVEARVGGKIAQLGSRLIDSFAKKMADEFFARFQQHIEGPAPESLAAAGGEAAEGEGEGEEKKGWFRRIIG